MNEQIMKGVVDYATENVKIGGGPFAAAIVKSGRIISLEGNSVTKINDPTAHAEIQAIRKACEVLKTFELNGYEIYSSCEPCPMCLGAIYWARLDRIYYAANRHDAANVGFDDSFIYDEFAEQVHLRKIMPICIPSENKLKPFEEWEIFSNKINY